ncbi:WxcM-like domain-containing protein [Chryseobacterium lathyri]|uniref:WxcM-like domain-containing protein n=1 Tax=Chryseobacterium lathyri TaxID=395933 RepID=UPI002781A6EC|nr:WxcM-like domain-containing protein [Chryseobacterium lathyri]MDQ0067549.1 dTDP-4-dehydrorhamnose 3,5-epimerase-like enzyme [Chryseobacterium lathyri]
METPEIFEGGTYSDERGNLFFNNNFNASKVKRIYCIENIDTEFIRGWTGHKIEQRWFSAIQGSFVIRLIKIDNWRAPLKESNVLKFKIDSKKLSVLHVPKGYVTAIQAGEKGSRLLVMADYYLGEIDDDFRFPLDYFVNL